MFRIAIGKTQGEGPGCWIDYSPDAVWASDKYLANGNPKMATTFSEEAGAVAVSEAAMMARPGLVCAVVPVPKPL